MLVAVFGIGRVVHHEFVPQGQTVNGEFYCDILRSLGENKRPEPCRYSN